MDFGQVTPSSSDSLEVTMPPQGNVEDALHKAAAAISLVLNATPKLRREEVDPAYLAGGGGTKVITEQALRSYLRMRSRRSDFFDRDLFADPAWDMLLTLLQERMGGRRISVSGLCGSAGVPQTTALRWLVLLEQADLVCREIDPFDGRRFYVNLTVKGVRGLERYFKAAGITIAGFRALGEAA